MHAYNTTVIWMSCVSTSSVTEPRITRHDRCEILRHFAASRRFWYLDICMIREIGSVILLYQFQSDRITSSLQIWVSCKFLITSRLTYFFKYTKSLQCSLCGKYVNPIDRLFPVVTYVPCHNHHISPPKPKRAWEWHPAFVHDLILVVTDKLLIPGFGVGSFFQK